MPPAASLRAHAGNAYDKYASTNPLARVLTRRFLAQLDGLVTAAAPDSLLDVGCGEGVVTARLARLLGDRRVVGTDRVQLASDWARHDEHNLSFAVADATELPFADGEFDLVAGIELLEQVAQADRALGELVRVARRAVIVSVPREPLWRVLNVLRGAYVGWLGNTPASVNHWSRRAFVTLVGEHGDVREVRAPLPWTMVLLTPRTSAAARRRGA